MNRSQHILKAAPLLLVLAMLFVSNQAFAKKAKIAPMEGIYYIGGEDADFANISDALVHVENAGIDGDVYFLLQDGKYMENVEMPEVSKENKDDKIVFQAAEGNSRNVVVGYVDGEESLASDNNIEFKNVTLIAVTKEYIAQNETTVKNVEDIEPDRPDWESEMAFKY